MVEVKIIGIDLAGPSNLKDTSMAIFEHKGGSLELVSLDRHLSDHMILSKMKDLSLIEPIVIGFDAPLSYADGGGDRKGDKELRKYITSLGMKSGSIMAPTFNRMAYLTLRGIRLTREIERLKSNISVVEVHPGAAIGSRLLPKDFHHVLLYKKELDSRRFLGEWFYDHRVFGLHDTVIEDSHHIDACAAALASWHWADPDYECKWLYRAQPPLDPYDFCC
ncbi:DUF429 domain-containing protein [Alteribacter aurantiacus]|uniref:DUF429 domain-containing protein n=1 Tax=Alteribacter aurantiacus TaxID=254410 RepID=UPI00054DAD38|nr:DUF429 domain-containing protein [Alteribacter aurantiacus]